MPRAPATPRAVRPAVSRSTTPGLKTQIASWLGLDVNLLSLQRHPERQAVGALLLGDQDGAPRSGCC